jgi:1-phosphatidylinositol-4-phosphate 5-kinase
MQQHRSTLLCRFFGLHRIKHKSWGKAYLLVMGNIFDTQRHIDEVSVRLF